MADPIFIVGRFRSGTSMVWSWFDRDPSCVAYYEPLHDNLIAHIGATQPVSSHRGIESYWSDYEHVAADLAVFHSPEFGFQRLHLEPGDQHEDLQEYVAFLLRSGRGKRVVAKLNRADFRIGWLRAKFPEAIVLYVSRNNRDVWLSSRRHLPAAQIDDPNAPDAFDQLQWSAALANVFPFLWSEGIDSFTRHYYLWRLSELAGRAHGLDTLKFDEIVEHPAATLDRLVNEGWLGAGVASEISGSIDREQASRWRDARSDVWFTERESKAEELLARLGLVPHFGQRAIQDIRSDFAAAWGALEEPPYANIIDGLNAYASDRRGEVTRLLAEVNKLSTR